MDKISTMAELENIFQEAKDNFARKKLFPIATLYIP